MSKVGQGRAAGETFYAMSRPALVGLTEGLARDLGPHGIIANLINPAPTDTDMIPTDAPGADEERSLMALGCFGRADGIAAMVALLAASAAGSAVSARRPWGVVGVRRSGSMLRAQQPQQPLGYRFVEDVGPDLAQHVLDAPVAFSAVGRATVGGSVSCHKQSSVAGFALNTYRN